MDRGWPGSHRGLSAIGGLLLLGEAALVAFATLAAYLLGSLDFDFDRQGYDAPPHGPRLLSVLPLVAVTLGLFTAALTLILGSSIRWPARQYVPAVLLGWVVNIAVYGGCLYAIWDGESIPAVLALSLVPVGALAGLSSHAMVRIEHGSRPVSAPPETAGG